MESSPLCLAVLQVQSKSSNANRRRKNRIARTATVKAVPLASLRDSEERASPVNGDKECDGASRASPDEEDGRVFRESHTVKELLKDPFGAYVFVV